MNKQEQIDELEANIEDLKARLRAAELRCQTAIEQADNEANRVQALKDSCHQLDQYNSELLGYINRVKDTDPVVEEGEPIDTAHSVNKSTHRIINGYGHSRKPQWWEI